MNWGRGVANKIAVAGLKERNGKTIGKVLQDTSSYTLQGLIQKNVLQKSAVFTDEHVSYVGLDRKGYQHYSVKHSVGEYVDGMAHTNGIESFWALLKRGLYGTYHNVSKKHLQRYVNEFAFKASQGNMSFSFVDAICAKANGNMLKYNKLTL
jgi:transposase-like protein